MVPCSLARIHPSTSGASGDISRSGSGHAARNTGSPSGKLRNGTSVASRTSGLNNPPRDGRNREIPDNADNQEDDIDAVGGFERKVRV